MRSNRNIDRHGDRSSKAWAIGGTLLFHALLLLCLLFCFLRYPPEGVDAWPPEPEKEIVFNEVEDLYASGEFVRVGDTYDEVVNDSPAPSSEDQPDPTQNAPDLRDAGHKADPSKVVSSDNPSPMKVDNKPKGPTKEELEAEKARQEAQRRQEAKKTADDATRRAFGGSGQGQSGQADGNSASGAVSGTPGNGVKGRTLEHWDKVSSTKIGEIAIRVKVDSQGKVVSATYDPTRSNGAVAADTKMRERCRQKSLECRFSVQEGAPTASGTIVWHFK